MVAQEVDSDLRCYAAFLVVFCGSLGSPVLFCVLCLYVFALHSERQALSWCVSLLAAAAVRLFLGWQTPVRGFVTQQPVTCVQLLVIQTPLSMGLCAELLSAATQAAQWQRAIVVVFARLPVPGKVKTRLAAGAGPQQAAAFYKLCAEHACLEVLR
jgi:hypothetical protein